MGNCLFRWIGSKNERQIRFWRGRVFLNDLITCRLTYGFQFFLSQMIELNADVRQSSAFLLRGDV